MYTYSKKLENATSSEDSEQLVSEVTAMLEDTGNNVKTSFAYPTKQRLNIKRATSSAKQLNDVSLLHQSVNIPINLAIKNNSSRAQTYAQRTSANRESQIASSEDDELLQI